MTARTDPTERLFRRTRRRLLVITFGLVAALVIGIGTVTAVVGLAALDADVDRSLQAAVDAAAAQSPPESTGEPAEVDDVVPQAADTFVVYLDAAGAVVASPSRIGLDAIPDQAAMQAMAAGASADWRTVISNGLSIRLLTVAMTAPEEGSARYVQGGFVLTLHDRQSRSLVLTIVGAAVIGIVAAAFLALVLTRRTLLPVRRAMDGQRRFVADASHELRTPAAIIRADAEVLEREGHVAPAGEPLLRDIVEESARLGRLVGDLLALATAERGGLSLQMERLDLADIARTVAGRIAPVADARDVQLVVRAQGPVAIAGDRDRLTQVLVVLLDNAIGHTPPGSVVELEVAARDGRAELVVRDHGPGVVPADRERIFEPFTRSQGGRGAGPVAARPGAGLGLAIARSFVAAHGGEISVDDAPGGGARFVVRLPVALRPAT